MSPWRSAVTFHTHAGLRRMIEIKNTPLLSSWAFLSQTGLWLLKWKRGARLLGDEQTMGCWGEQQLAQVGGGGSAGVL